MAAGIPAGAMATLTMDIAMVAAARYGGSTFSSDRLSPQVIGRWAAALMRGRLRHRDIMDEPARRGELPLGIATHYATGIALTEAFVLLRPRLGSRRRGGKSGFLESVAYGMATATLPLLILFPSLGYGWFARRSGETARLNRAMVLGHAAFGIGIGLWVPYFARRRGDFPR